MSIITILILFTAFLLPSILYADVILPFGHTLVYSLTFWVQFLFGILIEYWILFLLFQKKIESQRVFKLVVIMNLYSVAIGFVFAALDDLLHMGIRQNLTSTIAFLALSFVPAVIVNVLVESPVAFWLIPEISKRKMIFYITIANMCSIGFYLIGFGSFLGFAR